MLNRHRSFLMPANRRFFFPKRILRMFEDRNSTIDTINRLDIPKVFVSKATAIDTRKVSDFVKRRALPESDVARIKSAVEKLEFIWTVFAPYKIFFDSPELLEAAYSSAEITKQARETAAAQLQLDTATAEATEA